MSRFRKIAPSLGGLSISISILAMLLWRMLEMRPMKTDNPTLFWFLWSVSILVMVIWFVGSIIFSRIMFKEIKSYLEKEVGI